jgi:hypothetical protein
MNLKDFLIDFGNKFLFYIFVIEYILESWSWINTYGPLDYFTKIKIFLTFLPIVILPAFAKVILKDAANREESIRLFDVVYGVFIWILSLILSLTEFNIVSLIAVIIILFMIFNVITIIGLRYHPRLIFRLIIPFLIINALTIFFLIRIYVGGVEYYKTINLLEFVAGIIILVIVAFLFVYNEINELQFIFRQ